MKIAIDYRLASQHGGGMAIFLRNLSQKLATVDKNNQYELLDNSFHPKSGFGRGFDWAIREQLWVQVILPNLFAKQGFKVGFFPNPPVPLFLRQPVILTIADMAFWTDEGIPTWAKHYLWIVYFVSAKKAKVIITFSENSRRDIAKILKVRINHIRVLSLAPAEEIKRINNKSQIQQVLIKYSVEKPYILSVPGTFIPRKNVRESLQMFANLKRKLGDKYQLVIVGENVSAGFKKAQLEAELLDIKHKIVFTGRVNSNELSCLYTGSEAFICTSLYEGFGLPILEAMKCGTPVVSYNNSSLPEVVGQAGIMVKGLDELESEVEKVLKNKSLRLKLISKGLEQAKKFNWDKTTRSFVECINQTLQTPLNGL